MIDNSWALDIESRVFTKIYGRIFEELNKKYKGIYMTTADELSENVTKKYTIFINELEPVERGQTLDGQTINAVLSTFEVRVSTTTTKQDCRNIYKYVLDAFKDLGYEVTMIPTIKTQNDMHIGIGRFRRMIGALDII